MLISNSTYHVRCIFQSARAALLLCLCHNTSRPPETTLRCKSSSRSCRTRRASRSCATPSTPWAACMASTRPPALCPAAPHPSSRRRPTASRSSASIIDDEMRGRTWRGQVTGETSLVVLRRRLCRRQRNGDRSSRHHLLHHRHRLRHRRNGSTKCSRGGGCRISRNGGDSGGIGGSRNIKFSSTTTASADSAPAEPAPAA
jgi:uncharacterized membrane protein YgcG